MKKVIIGVIIILILSGTLGGVSFYFYNRKEEPKKVEKKKEKKKSVVKKVEEEKKSDSIFADFESQATEQRKKMTLDEKIGQIFLVRYEDEGAINITSTYHPGGYLLFAKDFQYENAESIRNKINNINQASNIPLAFAVDEEGGIVNRVSKFLQFRQAPFKSPQTLYNEGGMDLIVSTEREKADLLLSLGINLNLAPVADVSTNSADFIYSRSLGRDANTTADYIRQVVQVMNEKNISGCLKHFPGYGSNIDTHTDIAVDYRDYNNFVANDFKPFIAGIEQKVPAIMVSHNIIATMDNSLPSSLSARVHQILRQELKFTGIIITDDLAMGALKQYTQNNTAAIKALEAGNDLLITSDFINDFNLVKDYITKNPNAENLLNEAVDRVLAWKYTYKIIK